MIKENKKRVRIESLTDDNGPKKHFALKGIAVSLSEMKFDIDYTLSSNQVLDILLKSVRKFAKKQLSLRATVKEKIDYIHSLNIDEVVNLKVESVTESTYEQDDINFTRKLLHSCMSKPNRTKTSAEEMEIGNLTIYNENFSKSGFFAFDQTIENKWDGGSIYFKNKADVKKRLFNLDRIMADIIVIQALKKYEGEQPGLLKELLVEKFIDNDNKLVGVPPSFLGIQSEFLSLAKSLNAEIQSPTNFEDRTDLCISFYNQERLNVDLYVGESRNWKYVNKIQQSLRTVDFESLVDLKNLFNKGLPSLEELDFERYKKHPYFLTLVNGFVRDANIARFNFEEENDYRTCARAFEEKKNIKLTHRERMEQNEFLNFYGKVELDNDVRMQLFGAAEKDLMEIASVIPFPIRKDYEFKIKKLGKHRANGLFYPGLKMVLINVSTPDSFIHEVGHQLDHIEAEGKRVNYFSETSAFRHIRNQYILSIEKKVKAMPEDHPFRKQWEGNTKFSKLYYLNPTEIFARSFEVYMLKYELSLNSLLKTKEKLTNSEVHILDEEYVKIITEFFDNLLDSLRKQNKTSNVQSIDSRKQLKVSNVASGRIKNKENRLSETTQEVINGFQQLSLF